MASLIKKLVGKLFPEKKKEWAEYEYFDPSWKTRIGYMAKYIEPQESVCDLGCGMMWLKEYLTESAVYTGVDYKKRDEKTIVCDFNESQFPDVDADVYFISGCLEYIYDYESFIRKIATHTKKCIISYCITDFLGDKNEREKIGWNNHLSKRTLSDLFQKNGMQLFKFTQTKENYFLFVFVKA